MATSRPPPGPYTPPNADIGPYRLANRIAVGGMAEVFRAMLPQAAGGDRAVVIKRLLPHVLDVPHCRAMFEDEARIGQRIRHGNVVEVLSSGEDRGAPYLALEYVFGVDLWRLGRFVAPRTGVLPVDLAVYVLTEVLAGLEAVHGVRDDDGALLGVVHRDVSPENVFLSVHGDVKLGDLGIAQALLRASRATPAVAQAKGKLGYLAPEQLEERAVDARADVFAVGVIAAELLMGKPLFARGTELAVLLAIRDGDVLPFRDDPRPLPGGLREVVLAALERRPAARTPTAGALRAALLPFVTRPRDALASELGGLVMHALEWAQSLEGPIDRTSLAETVEADSRTMLALPALRGTPLPRGPLERAALHTPTVQYHVLSGSETRGPFTYAGLVRALLAGEVHPEDRVRIGGGVERPIARVPDLARHLPPASRTPTRRRIQMARTTEVYDLGRGALVGVLADAALAGMSGLLLCEAGDARKEVYLEDGAPAFVSSNRPEELLGENLVREGVISRAELDLALAAMPRFEGRLGDTLVATGVVDPVLLFKHIARHVREKLLDLFLWEGGRGSYYDEVDSPERSFPLGIEPWALLREGVLRRLAAGLDGERVARLAAGPVRVDVALLDRGRLPEWFLPVLDGLAAGRSLPDLEAHLEPDTVRACALILQAIGVAGAR